MTLLITAPGNAPASSDPSAVAASVKHMAGMLWYEMLTEMNQSGFSDGALGTGGTDFQSMFMWNLAENDFGKYDGQLNAAAVAQLAGPQAAASSASPPPVAAQIAATIAAAAAAPAAAPPAAPAPAASSLNLSGPLATRAVAFAQQLWPQITAAAQTLGVPPVAILAQSALETGWGAATAGNNVFGIKAGPGEGGTARATHEMVGGVLQAQTASFRDYATPAASVADYVGVIQNGFPSAVGQTTVAGYAQSLQNEGYATDQNYASKIVSIAQSPLMQQVLAAVQGQSSAGQSE